MNDRQRDLARLGWNEWFEAKAERGLEGTPARVVAIDRELLWLMDQTGTFRARLAGRFRYQDHPAAELPCVGDWVGVEKHPAGDLGRVRMLLQRRTGICRKAAGNPVEAQMIAANVDAVVIVQSCHYDFSLRRLERYLVMVREGGAEPWILLTKTDLVAPDVLAAQVAEIRAAGITAPVLTLSNVTREGLEELRGMLVPSRTTCFVGSSGVGKSTIINHLLGREELPTRDVSENGEGTHTTVRRELLVLAGGALVIDNPGMREFGVMGAEAGMDGGVGATAELALRCRYRNCSHTSEPGCAVQEAVAAGALSQEHYDHFLKLRGESEFHRLSALEKRRKDRDFGRRIKAAKKDLRDL